MHTPAFRRARSDEQREIRRQAILRVAAGMVAEMPVAELSLNELSRRVGLAKSNVLRYFESREAVLLELLDNAWRDWLPPPTQALPRPGDATAPAPVPYPPIAPTVTQSPVDDPLFFRMVNVSSPVPAPNGSPHAA